MLVISRTSILPLALAAALVFVGRSQPAFSQEGQPAAAQPQKNWKDRAEFDLYESITKEAQPAKRLELLNSWKEKYASSEFADIRTLLYLQTYGQLNRGAEVIATSNEVFGKDPNNLQALSATLGAIFTLTTPTSEQLATAEKAANQILSNADALFAADKKPQGVGDADWVTAKKNVQLQAQNVIGYVAWQRKDFDKAEVEFIKSLQKEQGQGQISYWLANVIISEKKPEKYSAALYSMARAVAYDGPGSLNPQGRQQVRTTLEGLYNQYHGSKEGLEQVLALAKNAALPPADFKILSKVDIANKKLKEEEEFNKNNPQLALWRSIKTELTGAGGAAYFDSNMKGALLPGGAQGLTKFTGKLIEQRPAGRLTKELVLAVENGTTPDVTLKLDAAVAGKMEPGAEIGFEGVASGYTASPFMVTFDVEKAKLTGWKGVAPAAAPTTKKSGGARKPAPKKK